jgi:hypothetical protein
MDFSKVYYISQELYNLDILIIFLLLLVLEL